MAIPQFRAEGVDQNGTTTSVTPSFAGFAFQANDIIEIVFATDGTLPTLSTANGFAIAQDPAGNTAQVSTSGGTAGAAECSITVFWKRATSTSDSPPVINTNGATCWCLQPNSFSGARTVGTPYNAISTQIVSTATANITSAPVTSTLANCLFMPRVASSNDDQAFNNWTMTGSANPSGTQPVVTGWHVANGNACAFVGDEGGFAAAGGPGTGTSTFGTATRQASVTLVMASLAENSPALAWSPRFPDRATRSALPAAAMAAALVAPILPPVPTVPPLSWVPTYQDTAPRARAAPIVGGISAPETVIPNPLAPAMSWSPSFPDSASRARGAPIVGGCVLPELISASASAPTLSWSPRFPDTAPRAQAAPIVGGYTGLEVTLSIPPLSWLPAFPDSALRARTTPIVGGAAQPDAVLPNPPAPALSWSPQFPDATPRARAAPIVGGVAYPEATLPNVLPPGMPWWPTFPDYIPRHRPRDIGGMTAPPFAGGPRLTTGAMTVRQNILSALPFSTPLTTFGTDVTFTAAAGTVLTSTGHGMINCAGPFTVTTTGTLPGGLTAGTLYYCAQPPDNNTFHLATSAANADAGTFVTMTNGGTGTHTLVRTGTTNTAPLYSTFVSIIERGTQSSSPNLPTDKYGNTYSYVSGFPFFFANFPQSAVSIAIKFRGVGGPVHTWSTSIGNVGGNQDEVLASGLEIFGAPILQDSSVVERPDGGTAIITSNPVATTARALLIAIINGNSNVGQENFWIFFDGFTKLPYISAEGDPSPAGYDQVCVAAKLVDIPGTYTFRAQGTVRSGGGPSGGIMTLLAFQAATSDLPPFDWLYPQSEMARTPRPRETGGMFAPPFVTLAPTPPMSWAPVYPNRVSGTMHRQQGGETAPPSDRNTAPFDWAPQFPDSASRARQRQHTDAAAPPNDTNAGPLTWQPSYPDRAPGPGRAPAGGTFAPPSDTNASPLVWLPNFPDRALGPGRSPAGGAVAPPTDTNAGPLTWLPRAPDLPGRPRFQLPEGVFAPLLVVAPVAPLSWSPGFPDLALRARQSIIPGGATLPEATLPNTPAVPLSWFPGFPDLVPHTRQPTIVNGAIQPEATLPDAPAVPLSWSPSFPGFVPRARQPIVVGGATQPEATLPNAPTPFWSPSFPDRVSLPLPRTHVGGTTAPPTDTNAGPLTWLSQTQGLIRGPRVSPQGGEFAPPPVVVTPLSWASAFPDTALRLRRSTDVSGATRPEATIPNPPAPPLSWAPTFPAFAPRALQPINVGGMVGPEATIPNPPAPPLSWAPGFPDFVLRPSQPINTGGMVRPVAPNLVPPRTTPPGRAPAQLVGHVATRSVEPRQDEDAHLYGTVRKKRDV